MNARLALTLAALALALAPAPAVRAAPPAAPAPKAANDDADLRALADEIARYRALHVEGLEPAYYLAGIIDEVTSFSVSASFGALELRADGAHRSPHVQVRAGTAALDDTNFADRNSFHFPDFGLREAPVEADYDALRQALWLELDDSYKTAVERLARKRAYLETNDVAERPADFSPAAPATDVFPRAVLQLDRARWTKAVQQASAVFLGAAHLETGHASFTAEAINQSFASSENARSRFGDTRLTFTLSVRAQAADGMPLERERHFYGRTEADLPKDAELVKAAQELAAQLKALVEAPALAEDYTGPVLFTGPAAGRFFLSAVAEPLSAPREVLGAPHEGRLVDRLGKHVASPLLTVRDDPTQKAWKGQPLHGWFPIDDEGVKSMPVTLVEKGVLKACYMSRVPTSRVAKTNGHARDDSASAGNVFVDAVQPLPREALKKKLIALAKAADLEYGLLVEDATGGRRANPFLMGRGSSRGDISLPSPTTVRRVYLDGHEELVRGASFKPAAYRVLEDIVGLGNDPTVVDATSFGQSVSVVAPSVLVKELDVKKPPREFEKLPAVARPGP